MRQAYRSCVPCRLHRWHIRLPFNVNSLSQAAAVETISSHREVEKTLTIIRRERERLFRKLEKIDGVTPYPSEANFIPFSLKNAFLVHERLLSEGVLIRNMEGVLKNSLRVNENNTFIKALKKILQ
ncbi:MAG TPA: aminotransferase class I/II-fold pyridoxal phosphate-dependent enzyme [Desulfobacterales bacterium]|nr:aminotransferase class I/II-fold pyridoxal phosphate-dependent enzyme [Desulfobacterales bacterium]